MKQREMTAMDEDRENVKDERVHDATGNKRWQNKPKCDGFWTEILSSSHNMLRASNIYYVVSVFNRRRVNSWKVVHSALSANFKRDRIRLTLNNLFLSTNKRRRRGQFYRKKGNVQKLLLMIPDCLDKGSLFRWFVKTGNGLNSLLLVCRGKLS